MILSPGQEIGKYYVEDVVGEGGMAVVYRVRHLQLGSVYALKVLSTPSVSVRDRMLKEGRIQAKLRHPNIVSVVDVMDVNGMTGLLMEYVRGPSLEALLAEMRVPLAEALPLFGGILAGVDAAHERGLIHRDLKPANVLLQPTDEGVYPKVTDFGIAKESSSGINATRTGVTMGTPSYIAPEQVEDAANVDLRADIFSLGTLLYELVCGVKAFDGRNALRILNAVMKGRYTPPEELRPDLPPNVVAAINGALQKKPEDRIGSCTEFARVLSGGDPNAALIDVIPRFLSPTSESANTVRRMAFATPPGAQRRFSSPPSAQTTMDGTDLLGLRLADTVGAPGSGSSGTLMLPVRHVPLLAPTLLIAVGAAMGALWSLGTLPDAGPALRAALRAEPMNEELDLPPTLLGRTYPAVTRDGVAQSKVRARTEPVDFNTLVESLKTENGTPPTSPWDNPDDLRKDDPLSNFPVAAPQPPDEGSGGIFGRKGPKPARFKLATNQDATRIMLTDGEQFWEPGRIPPGTYEVLAWFGTPESKRAGTISFAEAERLAIVCLRSHVYCTSVPE